MARFTVRVELHGDASGEVYKTLHTAMEMEGFTRTITETATGLEFQLPMAEYNITADRTKSQILSSAKRAARQVNRSFSILVTKSAGRIWYNLDSD
jgi:hypothetical protein